MSFEGVIEGEERLRFGDLEPVLKVDDIWNETSMMKSLNIIEVICFGNKYDKKFIFNILEVISTENKE